MTLRKVDSDEQVATLKDRELPGEEKLTAAQKELLNDMRISLRQMKRGEGIPACQALREIWQELEAEDDESNPDACVTPNV